MASMAHLARFRSNYWLILFFISCHNVVKDRHTVIPAIYVNAGDNALKQHDGFLYYNDRIFSGHTYGLYPDGDTALLFSYYNGREEGCCSRWFKGNDLMEKRQYINGKKEGEHKGWWPNGKPRFDYRFYDDEHDGEAKEWYSNGKPFRIFYYVKGHEEGLQKMWWPDGSVRANYVVKDGQQYGLIGRKLCINYDSTKSK